MNIFESIEIEDSHPFVNQTFKIPRGLSTIYGLNKTTSASRNGNAAGKSFFFSQLPEILHGSPVIGTSKDKVKTGTRTARIRVSNGKRYAFVRKNTKLSIIGENGKPVGRGVPETKEWLRKNFPLTETDIEAYVYQDSRRGHPLVMGKPEQRRNFLVEFFNLDKIDLERKLIKAERDELRKIRIQYTEVIREFKSVQSTLGDESLKDLKSKLEKWRDRHAKLQRKQAAVLDKRRLHEFVDAARKHLEVLANKTNGSFEVKAVKKALKEQQQSLQENLARLEDARSWEAHKKASRHYEKALDNLGSTARRVLQQNRLKEAKTAYVQYKEASVELDLLKDRLAEKPVKPEKVERPDEDYGELQAVRESLVHQLDHAEKFGEGACPTCGQSVKVKSPEKLRKALAKLDQKIDACQKYQRYKNSLAEYKQSLHFYKKHKSALAKTQSVVDNTERLYRAYRQLRALPEKPKPFTGKKLEVGVMERMVEEDRQIISAIEYLLPHLRSLGTDSLDTLLSSKKRDLPDYSDDLEKAAEKVAHYQARIEVYRSHRKHADKIKDRLQEMERRLKNEAAVDLLWEAYADKAMKRMAIQAIGSHLMGQVNKYASKFFPENYRFELDWSKTDLNILVHRRYPKRTVTTDVRNLSGAESRLFTYIMVLSLLAFVPENRRSSLLILDEPATNMSAETHQAFCELLEVMKSVIPSIIIITPNDDERYEGSKCFTVVKKKGESVIVEGHPSEIED